MPKLYEEESKKLEVINGLRRSRLTGQALIEFEMECCNYVARKLMEER